METQFTLRIAHVEETTSQEGKMQESSPTRTNIFLKKFNLMSDHFKISKRKVLAVAHRSCQPSENKSTIYEHQALNKNKNKKLIQHSTQDE